MRACPKRRKTESLPFGGTPIPSEVLGLLFWLVARYLPKDEDSDDDDQASIKLTCRAAFCGFRSHATALSINASRGQDQVLQRFYDAHPFRCVRHIELTFLVRDDTVSFFPWNRDTFPMASTMSVHTGCLYPIPSRCLEALEAYPLDITEVAGQSKFLDEIAARVPAWRWGKLQRVVIYTDEKHPSAFTPHIEAILRDHALDHVDIAGADMYLEAVMVHPPKTLEVDSLAMGLLAAHPRFDEIGLIKPVGYRYLQPELMGYPGVTADVVRKCLPKLDPMYAWEIPGEHHRLLREIDAPPKIRVAAYLECINSPFEPTATPVALDDIDFLVNILHRYACTTYVHRIINLLYAISERGNHEQHIVDKLVGVVRRVFASVRHDGDDTGYIAARAMPELTKGRSVANAWRLWHAYFTTCTFVLDSRSAIVDAESAAGDDTAHIVDYHQSVTLAELFLRGDEDADVLQSSFQYLYLSVYNSRNPKKQVSPEAAKQELLHRRRYIATLRSTLKSRKSVAPDAECKMIQIYEERLRIASECTSLLSKVLLGRGDFELR